MATKEFHEQLDEIGVALVDGNYLLVDKKKSLLSRFWTYVSGKITAQTNYVTSAMLRDSAALSVIGRSANSTGVPADIAAGSDGEVLRRSGTTLGFGTVATAGIAANAVTDALLRTSAALSVIGRSANSTGDVADIAAANDGEVLRRSGTTLGFGTVSTAGIGDGQVTGPKIAQSGTLDIGAASITTTGTVTTDGIKSNAGSPEGSVTAGVGAICRDTTNGWLWQKESGTGNTGWRIIGASGTYTPTAVATLNLDSVTPSQGAWIQVGKVVFVEVAVTIDPTAAGNVSYRITLPVASALSAVRQLNGTVITQNATLGFVIGDVTNDAASVTATNAGTASYSHYMTFGYEVV